MDENKKNNWKITLIIMFLVFILTGLVSSAFAYTQPYTNYNMVFPIQVMPKVNGFLKPNTDFNYKFVFSNDENCVNNLYTKSLIITTDSYGAGSTELNLSTMNGIPKYLCEYRNGNLRKVHPLNERLFLKQINEQDIVNMGFIKNDTNTQLNESQVDNFVSNNGYLKNETDPTVNLQKLQNLTFNDYHNLGGVDKVLNKSQIESMGFSTNDNDYCNNGVCDGNVTITGDLTLIGSLTNVNATSVNTNGSFVPNYDNVFDLGSNNSKWNNVYANNVYANIDYSKILNVPNFLLTETDPKIGATLNGQWCRGTGSGISCDVTPVVDTTLSDTDIFTMGYIKSFTENDPIYASSTASTITSTDMYNWNTAYSWGDPRNLGYITSPNDAVDSNELDNLCNQNGMILKRINNTWGCSNVSSFTPIDLLTDYNFTDNSNNWNNVYNDYYNNSNGYLTSFNETDPVFTNSPSSSINNSNINNWNTAYSWGNHNTQGYLKNETDPLYNNDKSNIVFTLDTTNWDKNVSDDFSGSWNALSNIPSGFADGIDDNTQYSNLSEFNNDVGYLTGFNETDPIFMSSVSHNINQTMIDNWNNVYSQINNGGNSSVLFQADTNGWDKNVSDDFNGSWSALNGVPSSLLDGDNDTTYSNLSEFNNDIGYYKNGDNVSFNNINTNSINVSGKNVCLEDGTNCQVTSNNAQIYNPKYITIKDDFIGDSTEDGELGELGWRIKHNDGSSTYYEDVDLNDIQTHPFVVTCGNSNKKNAGCVYSLGESFVINGGEKLGYVVQSTQLSGSVKNFGMTNYLSNSKSSIDDGVYMTLSESNSNIIGNVEKDGTINSCDTGVSINDYTWYQLEMRIKQDKSGVDFYVNDVYRCSVNTQLPTNPIGPKAVGRYTDHSTHQDIFKIDLFYMTYELQNNRWD